ncbi:MAG: HDOD domain-containing protein, partial [Planctomycetota bacterium]
MPNDAVIERIRILTERIDRLPAPGAVAIRLFEVTSSSTAGIDEVVSVLASDPSLASRILSLCRRCNHGLVQEVETLEHAVVLLGFDEIRSAALSIEICGLLGGDPDLAIAVDLRRHAVITAAIARTLTVRLDEINGIEPAAAFLAGLLHDLGHL